jgi:hypothetical protein
MRPTNGGPPLVGGLGTAVTVELTGSNSKKYVGAR